MVLEGQILLEYYCRDSYRGRSALPGNCPSGVYSAAVGWTPMIKEISESEMHVPCR